MHALLQRHPALHSHCRTHLFLEAAQQTGHKHNTVNHREAAAVVCCVLFMMEDRRRYTVATFNGQESLLFELTLVRSSERFGLTYVSVWCMQIL